MQNDDPDFTSEDNANVIGCVQITPTKRQEILYNISQCVGPSLPWEAQNKGFSSSLIGGIVGVLGGMIIFLGAIRTLAGLVVEQQLDFEYVPTILLIGSTGIWFVLLGYSNLLSAIITHSQSQYAEHIYEKMIIEGEITDGKIISLKQTKYGNKQFEYWFTLPDKNETINGVYTTSTKRSFAPGDVVAVLYLNRYIHILLVQEGELTSSPTARAAPAP